VATAAGPVPVDYSTNSFTEATNRTFATPTYLAVAASRPFPATGNGFADQPSDGLTQLTGHHTLAGHQNASDGDVTTTVELPAGTSPTTLVLGFGPTENAAVSTALASARTPFSSTLST
jgi:glucoamylase